MHFSEHYSIASWPKIARWPQDLVFFQLWRWKLNDRLVLYQFWIWHSNSAPALICKTTLISPKHNKIPDDVFNQMCDLQALILHYLLLTFICYLVSHTCYSHNSIHKKPDTSAFFIFQLQGVPSHDTLHITYFFMHYILILAGVLLRNTTYVSLSDLQVNARKATIQICIT